MKYFDYTKPKMLVADKGKVLRDVNDVYKETYVDENGILIEEHIPYKTTTIFLPDNITEEEAMKMYIEEDIEEK